MPPSDFPQTLSAGTTTLAFDGAAPGSGQRLIPVETGVSLVYSGLPFAVMMLTPADLEDFAVGFSLTEGIIAAPGDIRGIRVEAAESGITLAIDLAPDRLRLQLARRRAMTGRTSCGVCGVEDLASLTQAPPGKLKPPRVSLAAIRRSLLELEERQTLNRATHAVHGAAWAGLDGRVRLVREDVGRHNALDKLIGALLREAVDPRSGLMLITSRCSFEMIEKTAVFGAGTVVAISAPTSLAIERVRSLGMTLIGLARHDSVTVFEGGQMVIDDLAGLRETAA